MGRRRELAGYLRGDPYPDHPMNQELTRDFLAEALQLFLRVWGENLESNPSDIAMLDAVEERVEYCEDHHDLWSTLSDLMRRKRDAVLEFLGIRDAAPNTRDNEYARFEDPDPQTFDEFVSNLL